MPNRIIKESICTSEDIAKLSQGAEILFYRLIVHADDYGRYFGNPSIVKSNCFPLLADDIQNDQVSAWLQELEQAGLILLYTGADGRKYLQFTKWDKHQQIRSKKSKFPAPDSNGYQMISNDIKCQQVQAIEIKCSRNPIQSNPNPIRIQSESANDEDDDDDGFEEFWKAYPRKSGDIREAYFAYVGALQKGAKLSEMLDALKWQTALWAAEDPAGRYIPSPTRWLENRKWTEKKREPVKKVQTAADYDAATAALDGKKELADLDRLAGILKAAGGEAS